MTAQTYQADDHQLAQQYDQQIPANDLTEPDDALTGAVAEVPEPDADVADGMTMPGPADQGEPGAGSAADSLVPDSVTADSFTADSAATDSVMADNVMADNVMADSDPGIPMSASEPFVAPESVTESHPAIMSAAAAGEPWNAIQALFVDDPRASVERAAGLLDERVEHFIQSVRDRQQSAQSAWQADGAGTEELRVALQHYRTFWTSLEGLPEQN